MTICLSRNFIQMRKLLGFLRQLKKKKKLKRFSAVLFLFSKWNILQLSKITKQKFITNISAWTCKTFTMPARHRQGHCFMTCLPIQKKYLVAWTERAGRHMLSPSLKISPLAWSPSMKLNSAFFLSLRQTTPHQNNLYFEQQHDTVPFWSGSLIHHPKGYPEKCIDG